MGVPPLPLGRSFESPGMARSSGKNSILGITQSATRAPPGSVNLGRRLMALYGNGP
jgi:hypothetical protein